jgi:hypothetical protein
MLSTKLDFVSEALLELYILQLIADDEFVLGSTDESDFTASREWSLVLHCCVDVFTRCISAWL